MCWNRVEQGQKTWMVSPSLHPHCDGDIWDSSWSLQKNLLLSWSAGAAVAYLHDDCTSTHSSCPGAVLNIQPNGISLVLPRIEWAISEHLQYLQKILQTHHPVISFRPGTPMMERDLSGTLRWCPCSDQSSSRAGEGSCAFHFWNNWSLCSFPQL